MALLPGRPRARARPSLVLGDAKGCASHEQLARHRRAPPPLHVRDDTVGAPKVTPRVAVKGVGQVAAEHRPLRTGQPRRGANGGPPHPPSITRGRAAGSDAEGGAAIGPLRPPWTAVPPRS